MSDFLLVHGSGYGAWCWSGVMRTLKAEGHRARAIDLPRNLAGSVNIASYASAILSEITTPVTLVGHSSGGFAIAAAAEAASPGFIERLIFLCAYAPRDGASVASMRRGQARQPLRPAIILAPDRRSYRFDPGLGMDCLFHDCDSATAAEAMTRMVPEPVDPQEEAIHLTARYHALAKHYIRCLDDRAIPPECQAAMTNDWPAGTVSTLAAGHSPFLSCPEALAKRLIAVAANPLSCQPTPG
ncbi:alpha/beta fold hydrolase [Rhodobacter sp. NSM]|uniref:alpha/beta fold hydrolase n=1 Tax=Rhodobacter sp. NSM TaxID=3457501 RepID=UPI003FCFFB0A